MNDIDTPCYHIKLRVFEWQLIQQYINRYKPEHKEIADKIKFEGYFDNLTVKGFSFTVNEKFIIKLAAGYNGINLYSYTG